MVHSILITTTTMTTTTTTAILMPKPLQYKSILSTFVVGKWLVESVLKTTASAILATTTTTNTPTHHSNVGPLQDTHHPNRIYHEDLWHQYLHSNQGDRSTSIGNRSFSSSSSSSSSLLLFGRDNKHHNENDSSYGSNGGVQSSLPLSRSSLPHVTSWSPSLPFRSSSSLSRTPIITNSKVCPPLRSQLYSMSTSTATTHPETINDEDQTDMNMMVSSRQSQPHYHDSSSWTKGISRATSAPVQLSTTTSTTSNTNQPQQSSAAAVAVQQEYNISLRLATISDISSISSCNIQTLPENYNDMFYMNHIHEYPYLSLVAVIDEPPMMIDEDEDHYRQGRPSRPIHGNYEPTTALSSSSSSSSNVETPPPKLNFIQRHLQTSKRRFATTFWTPQQPSWNSQQQQYSGVYNSHLTVNYETNNGIDSNHNNDPTSTASTTTSKSIVVGYLLGKIIPPQEPYQYSHYQNYNNNHDPIFGTPNNTPSYNNNQQQHQQQNHYRHYRSEPPYEMIGHVSSLAVLPEARRRGLAKALLEQFHHHLSTMGPLSSSSVSSPLSMNRHQAQSNKKNIVVTSTGLHVRCSNVVAVQLYERLGYTPAVTIPAYYEDGENAFYMQKMFVPQANNRFQEGHKHDGGAHKRQRMNVDSIACCKDEYHLPRVINVLNVSENDSNVGTKSDGFHQKGGDELCDSIHSTANNSIHEEEEEEQMLMNGIV